MPHMLDDPQQVRDVNRPVDDQEYPEQPTTIQHAEIGAAIEQMAQSMKITANSQKESTELRHSPCEPSLSTNTEQNSDAASGHSMPMVQVTEPTSPTAAIPPSPSVVSGSSGLGIPPPSPSNSQTPSGASHLSQQERRSRHRSEIRSSNRLSGFFSNLIHRRESPGGAATRSSLREESTAVTSEQAQKNDQGRPATPPRPVTPPPSLPAPTLQELGLSLSAITSELSPPHFSAPPSSGAFLSPHYLLLCHAQGLDVLPLVSPPAPQSYTLVRRVGFKSVVVMEQRGVLVAIAGRRDGVRVYALEEIRRVIEWRMEVETRRERERMRREALKKTPTGSLDGSECRSLPDKLRKSSLPMPSEIRNLTRRGTYAAGSTPPSSPPPLPQLPPQLIPRRATTSSSSLHIPQSAGNPPSYDSLGVHESFNPVNMARQGSVVDDVLSASSPHHTSQRGGHQSSPKVDWIDSSDEEAIDILAAGPSGSQALDERTSSQPPPPPEPGLPSLTATQISPSSNARAPTGVRRTRRPSNLDLSLVHPGTPSPEPSPAPSLLTLRQALSQPLPPPSTTSETTALPDTPFAEGDEDDDDGDGRISLAQALLESRLPDLPPLGTQRPQQPILITASHPSVIGDDDPVTPRTSGSHGPVSSQHAQTTDRPQRRRRWSIMIGSGGGSTSTGPSANQSSQSREASETRMHRSHSVRSAEARTTSHASLPSPPPLSASPTPMDSSSTTSRSSRFFPRIFSNAFTTRKSEERPPTSDKADDFKRGNSTHSTIQASPPKLDYVKLPGTKGSLMVKAVETPKKSFLAILCGEHGEKVELFAGTYKTALGLSRTFILPDSPRSLELQLQGDDLVEVFLVFSQNVFGLEPATVRVREVRIGRAERRAARRRAREYRAEANDSEAAANEEETNVNVSIGVSVPVGRRTGEQGDVTNQPGPQEHPETVNDPPNVPPPTEELVTVATAQMGPYTTFQQLSFAPKFPLASIADDYIIPPTYRDFMNYRAEHEPENLPSDRAQDLTQIQFTPPGLPLPSPAPPSRWYYRDPKNTIHGPWKASLMQAWYKDGLLPPDLPVRREEDSDYILLKDLRAKSVDPSQPFLPPLPPAPLPALPVERTKPLLSPISLLSQSRQFGPPALFYSSRGGHSTTIVDSRGRSVLKGRFFWSDESHDEMRPALGVRMGDVKRLEAFDVNDRSVIVAMRQGGLEAMDFGDALLRPADESRTAFPYFNPTPSNTSRRGPFVWKIGMPVSPSSSLSSPMSTTISKSRYSTSPLPLKKPSLGPVRSPIGRSEFSSMDVDPDVRDEVLFLGRKDDEIYFCERNAGTFRILRLSPDVS